MADRYWVGTNGGSWTPTATGGWSATSGGAPGASAPTQNDNVFFDANSNGPGGPIVYTDTGSVNCRSLSLLGWLGQLQLNTALSVCGDLDLSDQPGVAGNIRSNGGLFRMAGAGAFSITSRGKSFLYCGIRFENTAGAWTLQDDLYIQTTGGVDLRAGTLNTNGKTITIDDGDFLALNGTGPRTVNLGGGTLMLGRNLSLAAATVFNATGSVIHFTGASSLLVAHS